MSERGLYMAFAALAWSLGTNIGYDYSSQKWIDIDNTTAFL
jgi:hypothetical protein